MQELIKIEKRVIGAEEVNSVDAKELYKALEINKDFTNWIKAQINRAGIQKNVDYTVSEVASDGGRPQKVYVLTTDSSKHIAMMSQGTKAKEVRDYFIAVEKEYVAQNSSQAGDMLAALMPVLQKMMEMMGLILQNQTQQALHVEVNKNLTPEQLGKIRGAVNLAAAPIGEYFGEANESEVKRVIYQKLNDRLGVASYIYIPACAFEEAMSILNSAQERYELKLQKRKNMKLDVDLGQGVCHA